MGTVCIKAELAFLYTPLSKRATVRRVLETVSAAARPAGPPPVKIILHQNGSYVVDEY